MKKKRKISDPNVEQQTLEDIALDAHELKEVQKPTEVPDPKHSGRSELYRLRKWQIRSKTQMRVKSRALPSALSEFDRLSVALKLPQSVRNLSSKLIREAWTNGLIVGGVSVICMVGAVIYAACRIQEIPRKLSRVASKVGISEKKLSRCYRKLKFGINLQIPLPDPVIIVPRIIQRVKASEEVRIRAIEILKIAKENDLYAGRDPWGLAASAIYLAAIVVGSRVSQKVIANASGVTEVTIRNRSKELREVMGDSFFSDWS